MNTTEPRRRQDEETARLADLGRVVGELFHDLVGVTALLRGSAELARDETNRGRIATSEVESVCNQALELERMIADVFEEIRGVRAGAGTRFPVAATVDDVVRRWRIEASSCSVNLHRTIESELELAGRSSFFSRALRNLLNNAGRHARREIEIRVSEESRQGGAWLVVAVEDDGSGVEAEVRGALFTPFTHGGHGGTGFGLSYVRWAARQLGGEVEYVPGERLGGACFRLCIPLPAPMRPASPPPSLGDPDALAGATVVVVDDDERLLSLYERIFERVGASVVTLRAVGDETDRALPNRILEARPHVVLLDRRLGGSSGDAVCGEVLRRRPDLRGAVAILTGGGIEARDRTPGAVPVIDKTLDIASLIKVVACMAERRRLRR